MSINQVNPYDFDPCIAELYDAYEIEMDDLRLIRKLLGDNRELQILEPFAGTGRLLIPLALDGHTVIGLDQAPSMLAAARAKVERLPADVRQRITLVEQDVTGTPWPGSHELVLLGGNCLYELATPAEQEGLFRRAAEVLRTGGYLYVDNNHMEGPLDPAWQQSGVQTSFPSGTCHDGTTVRSWIETIWYDEDARLVRFRRTIEIAAPGEVLKRHVYVQQKHPVSAGEVEVWLRQNDFRIEARFGDREGNAYTKDSPRAIFWARLEA